MRISLILASGFAACFSAAASAEHKVGQNPPSGAEAKVTIGSPLLERYDMDVSAVLRLKSPVNVSLGIQGKIAIPASAAFVINKADPVRVCTLAEDTYIDNFVGPRGPACLTDSDMNGDFDRAEAASVFFTKKRINPPVPYGFVETAGESPDSFKEVLIFTGAGGGTLRVSYRQFKSDMARPAFTEDLSFPIEPIFPQTIMWRNTRITLVDFSGGVLRYRVEAGQ